MPKLKTKEEFIENAISIHNNKYDYSLVEYKGNKLKVKIICNIHGEFEQIPNDHTRGHGCRKCSEEFKYNYNMKDSFLKEHKNKPLDLYIITLYNNTEKFIKIGVSKEVIRRHINIKTKSSYNIEVNLILPLTVSEGTIIENKLLKKLKQSFNYKPIIKFPGYTECISYESKDNIIEELYSILDIDYNKSNLVGKILDWEYKNKK